MPGRREKTERAFAWAIGISTQIAGRRGREETEIKETASDRWWRLVESKGARTARGTSEWRTDRD